MLLLPSCPSPVERTFALGGLRSRTPRPIPQREVGVFGEQREHSLRYLYYAAIKFYTYTDINK